MTFTSGYTVDTALSDTKIRFEDNVTKLHDAMAKKQKAIDELKKPSGEEPSKKTVLKQDIEICVIGGFRRWISGSTVGMCSIHVG